MTQKHYREVATILSRISDETERENITEDFGRMFGRDSAHFDFPRFAAAVKADRWRREAEEFIAAMRDRKIEEYLFGEWSLLS